MNSSRRKLFRVLFNLFIVAVVLAGVIGPFSFASATTPIEPWSFGVMGDTQWTCPTDPAGENPGACSVSIINQLNAEFIEKGVKFVIQTGDLTNATGNMSYRAVAAQPLYDAGIGFFPARGNHDIYANSGYGVAALKNNFPQTRGLINTFGATNFSSPAIHEDLDGLSYAFNFGIPGNNATFVIVDDWATPSKQVVVAGLEPYVYGYSVAEQQGWINSRLDKTTRGTKQAFVFSHHNLMPEYHYDCLFTGYADSNLDMQNAFFASLQDNGVRYFFSGHEHLYNRSLVTSPDGLSVVEDIICSNADTKFLLPKDPTSAKFYGQKDRQMQISQQLKNVGYYICTVDGPRVTVDYYADETGGYLSDANWPRGTGEGNQITPDFNFVKVETWGYSLNGQEFLVAQGANYTSVVDSYKGTTASILSGVNDCTDMDYFNRQFTKTVDTGWTSVVDFCHGWGFGYYSHRYGHGFWHPWQPPKKVGDALCSNILSLWGMADFGTDETDGYALSMTYERGKTTHLGNGTFGIATLDSEGNWVNAVDMNYGGVKEFVKGPWKAVYGLGTYGIDTRTKTVWAVLNYNGDFAVARDIEPVPGHRK